MKSIKAILRGIVDSVVSWKEAPQGLVAVNDRRGWDIFHLGGRPETDFQRDIELRGDAVFANWAVFACFSLIAGDLGKLRFGLMELMGKIWQWTSSPAFSPLLRKPNRYQTWQQFIESWVLSKLSAGNTYVLKVRDDRKVVVEMYVLDPNLVTPLVSPSGHVYYRLGRDLLSGVLEEQVAAPAREVMHDRMNCLFHHLVGLSPLYAAGLAATVGVKIQRNAARLHANMSRPSGILVAPEQISDETANRLKTAWEQNYGGDKIGKVAVLGDGLKYEPLAQTAVESQMNEQVQGSAIMVCSTFNVPPFKIGAGPIPAGQTVEGLNRIYYADCLQKLMKAIENVLDDGLGLLEPKEGRQYGTSFNRDDLLEMDSGAAVDALNKAVGGGWMAPNEARERRDLPPVKGGATPLMQQQNYSLEALAKRDAQEDPFRTAAPPSPPALTATDDDGAAEAAEKRLNDFEKTANEHLDRWRAEGQRLAVEQQARVAAEQEAAKQARAELRSDVGAELARLREQTEQMNERASLAATAQAAAEVAKSEAEVAKNAAAAERTLIADEEARAKAAAASAEEARVSAAAELERVRTATQKLAEAEAESVIDLMDELALLAEAEIAEGAT